MFIYTISNQSFRALVPKSEYKGVILKLTPKDKKKIAELISKKSFLEFELVTIDRLLDKKKTIIESSGLFCRREHLLGQIHTLENMIKDIKAKRLEKQQALITK